MDEMMLKKLEEARKDGKVIGLVQGSWDMFHIGHLRYLQEARKLCDYLIVGMDSDEKIRYRKGNKRPIIPEEERYQMLEALGIADVIVVKAKDEVKWGLIKTVKPDVLVAIQENYKEEEIKKLEEFCGRVAILPRQATTSTSDIIRRTLILSGVKEVKVEEAVRNFKNRINFNKEMATPIPELIDYMKKSTDWITPVAACCFYNGKWEFGVNKIDEKLSEEDIDKRSELFYATVEHAEINLLKKLGNVEKLDTPIWTTLFPCDKCMKVLIDKGVKEIYYLEDHPEKNWSKRSHELAEKNQVKLINVLSKPVINLEEHVSELAKITKMMPKYRFIDPRNVRREKQLEIMLDRENAGEDPLDPNIIDQEILFTTKYWYVSRNRFPYDEIEHQFLIAAVDPIYDVKDMPIQMWQELREIWEKLRLEYNLPGGALCYRFGDTQYSGASLKRVHSHLIVPKEENKTKFTIGGNKVLKKEFLQMLLEKTKND